MTSPSDSGRREGGSTSGPPPWQRGRAAAPAGPGSATAAPAEGEGAGRVRRTTTVVDAPTSQIKRSDIPNDMPDLSTTRRPSQDGPRSPRTDSRPRTTGPRTPSRGPRRAALQVKHIDPWSALKLSLVLSVALFLVWMIAVGVLYLVLDGMGVWSSINKTFTDFVTVSDPTGGGGALIGPGRVFGVAAVVGLVNVVLFTALATISSFVYNLSADLAGGVEVTLTERD